MLATSLSTLIDGYGGIRRAKRRCRALLVLVAAAGAFVPCGSHAVEPQGGVTATEVRLGMSAAFSRNARALGIELYRGAMAYFHGINDSGGIHGRRIVIKAYDDRYEPEPAIRNTLRLMKHDDVFALINYVGTPTMNRALPLLRKYRESNFLLMFPFTGANTNRIPPYDRFSINLRASYAQETQGLVDRFVAINRERIAVFYQADGYGRAGWAGVHKGLARHGLRIAGEATYRRGTPFDQSYDRQVAIMEEIAPDAIICIGAYAGCGGFIRDARIRNMDVPIGTVSFVGSEAMLNLLSAAGRRAKRDFTARLVNSQVVPSYHDDTIPVVREYKEKMARYRADIMPPRPLMLPAGEENEYRPLEHSFTSLEGFLNAKLFAEILRRLGPHPTRAALARVTMNFGEIDIGLNQKLSLGGKNDRRQASDLVYFTGIENGRFVPLDDSDWKAWAKP